MGTLIRLFERSASRSDVTPDTDRTKTASMPAEAIQKKIAATVHASDALSGLISAMHRNLEILDTLAFRIEDAEEREELRRRLSSLSASLVQSSAGLQTSIEVLRGLERAAYSMRAQ